MAKTSFAGAIVFFDTFMGQGQDDPRADGSVPSRGRQSQTENRWLKKSTDSHLFGLDASLHSMTIASCTDMRTARFTY